MRLYKRISRFRYNRMFSKSERRLLKWATSLKPGDLISGCTTWPFSTEVERVEVRRTQWYHGSAITDVSVYTTDGRHHSAPGGGCVERPLTPEQIRQVLIGNQTEEGFVASLERSARDGWTDSAAYARQLSLFRRAKNGQPICDEKGRRLPEDQP